MESAKVPDSDQDYAQQVKKLRRFFQRGGGNFAFATATHEGVIRPLNESLRSDLHTEGIRLRILFLDPEGDKSAFTQIQSTADESDALIVVNLHDYLPGLPDEERAEAKDFLEGFNFAREGLLDLGKPILFWVPKMDTFLLTNHAVDLYSMRRMHVWVEKENVAIKVEWTSSFSFTKPFGVRISDGPELVERSELRYEQAKKTLFRDEGAVFESIMPLVISLAINKENRRAKNLFVKHQNQLQEKAQDVRFQNRLAEVYFRLKKPEMAIQVLRNTISSANDESPQALLYWSKIWLALTLVDIHKFKEARDVLENCLDSLVHFPTEEHKKNLNLILQIGLIATLLLQINVIVCIKYSHQSSSISNTFSSSRINSVISELLANGFPKEDSLSLFWGVNYAIKGQYFLSLSVLQNAMPSEITSESLFSKHNLGVFNTLNLTVACCDVLIALGNHKQVLTILAKLTPMFPKGKKVYDRHKRMFTHIITQAQQHLNQDPHQSSPEASY